MVCGWVFNTDKKIAGQLDYPYTATNADKIKKLVYSPEEHLDHALNTVKDWPLATRLRVSNLDIDIAIPANDEAWMWLNTYFAAERWGITFLYPSIEQMPNSVWWAINEVNSFVRHWENEQHKKESKHG